MNILTKTELNTLLSSGRIELSAGTYCFPIDFSYDFGSLDVYIQGVAGKTVITTYDGTAATDFSPKEIDTTQPDNNLDGLYVVGKHPVTSYGGGLAHLNLKGVYNTNGENVFYVQGTVLKKSNGIWSRHYTGAGFITQGNLIVKDVIFDNCQFYILSPFSLMGKLTTSENFEVDNCKFNNVARVISSITYGGIDQKPNWYNTLQYYSAVGQLRFKNFKMTNNEFSKIHSFIVGGFPPSEITTITNNTIRDCNTILHCFNLFIKCYGNDDYFRDRISQNISNNFFINIKPIANNWTTSLIRTSGMATINANQFIDCSQQICFLSGGQSIFSNNMVSKWVDGVELQSPVILVKTGPSTNLITGNNIVAPMSTIVALEGTSNTIITGNNIIGLTRYRTVSPTTLGISKDRVYYVTNLAKFKELAINYDNTVINNCHVFYNKTTQKWSKTVINNIGFLFSKADGAIGTQYLKVSNNVLEVEGLTNVSSRVGSNFKSILINDNDITGSIYLHLGLTPIDDYVFTNNYLKTPLTHSGTQVRNIYNENNKVAK